MTTSISRPASGTDTREERVRAALATIDPRMINTITAHPAHVFIGLRGLGSHHAATTALQAAGIPADTVTGERYIVAFPTYGCALCDVPESFHLTRHHHTAGQHRYRAPSDELVAARADAHRRGETAPDRITRDRNPEWIAKRSPHDDPDAVITTGVRTSSFEGPIITINADDAHLALTPTVLAALLPQLQAALAEANRRDAELTR